MSVMKFYLMTIAIFLILVQKTPGGLFRSHNINKQEEPWNPCELYQATCRNTCRRHEVRYFSCLHGLKCCLKIAANVTSSASVKEGSSSNSSLSVTNSSSHPQS